MERSPAEGRNDTRTKRMVGSTVSTVLSQQCGRTRFRFVRTKKQIMAITKQKKVEITAKIADAVKDAVSIVFVRFSRLSVKDTSQMRKELREGGVGYYVAKKTLIKRVLNEQGYTGTLPDMPGEIAMVWSKEDATAPARDIYAMGKKFKDTLTIVGGIWDGAFADATAMNAIATIPPLPVLRGMFVNVLNSPIQGLVIALDKVAEKKAA
ncbi:MAG: rplJ [Parcubacteria group bacterium]|nr:rplJ [Parcubacteria group bacterium]